MEDFGYLKYEEQGKASVILKKGLIIGAVLLSILCFGYITISAYYFVYHEEDSKIKIIKSPKNPIKVTKNKNDSNIIIKNMDKAVYENIVGGKKESLKESNIKIVKTPKNSLKTQNNKTAEGLVKHSRIIKPENRITKKQIIQKQQEKKEKIIKAKKEALEKQEEIKGPLNRVQIAALSSEEAAKSYYKKLKKQYPKLFDSNLKPFIKRVDLGKKGIFYRLQIGNFNSQIESENFCIELINQAQKSKVDCIIVE